MPKRKMYACHVDLGGDKFLFAGILRDRHGGLVRMGFIDGKKYQIGLRGKAIGLYEKVTIKS